jgi:hypothetical protein
MLRLLLTADYEIFGNGTGDIAHCLINPAHKMMESAERFNGRVTFFVDVCELWAFEQAESEGTNIGCQQPATRIKEQLQSAIARGHDVQLHAHPQWIGAKWINGAWHLNMEHWRIGLLPLGNMDAPEEASARFILRRGKEFLEDLLRPIDPTYRCNAFRAGAWSIQPEADVLTALAEANIQVDTTVAPGSFADDGLSYFDFRATPRNLPFWRVKTNVHQQEKDGHLLEVPIFSKQYSVYESVSARISRRQRLTSLPSCTGKSEASARRNRSLGHKINKVFARQERQQMFDFCMLSASEMQKMVQAARQRFAHYLHDELPHQELPLVAIGHPKNYASPQELETFLEWMARQADGRLDQLDEPSFWRQPQAMVAVT